MLKTRNIAISGAGGGGGKGGGSGRVAQEDPNTLQSKSTARVIDVLSEGEIVGLVNGAKSIYFNDTPLKASDDTANFNGVEWSERYGLPTQDHVTGFASAESEVAVNVQIKKDQPITRSISDVNTNAVRVTVRVNALTQQDKESGDLHGSSVEIAIDVKTSGGTFIEKVRDNIVGKTTSPYERAYHIALTGAGPWDIRVRRLSDDNKDASIQNDVYFQSFTAIIDGKLIYPDTAYLALTVSAEQFGASIPTRSYDVKGIKLRVPTNYDPVARTYSGIWDGTFKIAWSDNPAWVLYDIITNPRYGLGGSISDAQVDKWSLYTISQYCDQLIPSGFKDNLGADILEPRYTFNGIITSREDAYQVVQAIASNFRGIVFWASGQIFVRADMPSDPIKLVTPANVIDGAFSYSGSALKARHTAALVAWNDPEDGYRQTIEVVEDPDGILTHGWRQVDVTAFGCTRRSQARRMGLWMLDSEKYETELVTYRASFDHADLSPGDIIAISDPNYAMARFGGRVLGVNEDRNVVSIDAPVVLEPGESYTLMVMLPDGTIAQAGITNATGSTSVLNLSGALSGVPVAGAVWAITGTDLAPRKFRVQSLKEVERNIFEVTALFHDPNKYARIEQGLYLPAEDYIRPSSDIPTPQNFATSESRYIKNNTPRSRITLSWSAVKHPYVSGYTIVVTTPSGVVTNMSVEKTTSLDVDDAEIGTYVFALRAKTFTGQTSPPNVISHKSLGWEDIPGLSVSHLQVDGQGASTTFSTRDPVFTWRGNFPDTTWQMTSEPAAGAGRIDPRFRDYVVRIYDTVEDRLLRTEYTTDPSYRYTLEKNRADSGILNSDTARRRIRIDVSIRDTLWRESAAATLQVYNPPPPLPKNLVFVPALGAAHITFDLPTESDFSGTVVHKSTFQDFIPSADTVAARSPGSAFFIETDPNVNYWIRLGHYDAFGEDEILYTAPQLVQSLFVIDTTPPDVPTNFTLTTETIDGAPVIKATWTAVTARDLARYELSIKPTANSDLSWQTAFTNDTSYTWSTGLIAGTSYDIRLRATDTSTNDSSWTATETIVAARDTAPPGPVTDVTALSSFRSIWLSWTAPADSDYAYAEVWEASSNNIGAATKIGVVPGSAGAVSVMNRSGLNPGTTRFYFIRSVDTSDNAGPYADAVSATTASLVFQDFPVDFGPIPTGSTLPTGAPDGPVDLFFKTPEYQLYRYKNGAWEKAIQLAEAAGTITSTQIADGSISTPKLAAGAITADKIAANSITSDKIAANSISTGMLQAGVITAEKISSGAVITSSAQIGTGIIGDAHIGSLDASKIRAGSVLSGSITVNGQSLTTIQQGVGDPAAAINAGTTKIDPGKILISGSTTLGDWRHGGDNTQINGGAIAANTISANKLFVGARNVVAQGFSFRAASAGSDTVVWDAGSILLTGDDGNYQRVEIIGGSTTDYYMYWVKGENYLRTTLDTATAKTTNGVLMCINHRGGFIIPVLGGSYLDGSRLVTESITASQIRANAIEANHIAANSIAAGHLQAGSVGAVHIQSNTIGASHITVNAVTRDKLALKVIGGAQIDDLAVDRANIKDLTINGEKIEDLATSNVSAASGTTSATVSLTTKGRPVVIIAVRGVMQRTWAQVSLSSEGATGQMEITQPDSLAWAEVQQPGAGNHSWTVNNGSGWPTQGWSQAYNHYCAIVAMEFRK